MLMRGAIIPILLSLLHMLLRRTIIPVLLPLLNVIKLLLLVQRTPFDLIHVRLVDRRRKEVDATRAVKVVVDLKVFKNWYLTFKLGSRCILRWVPR